MQKLKAKNKLYFKPPFLFLILTLNLEYCEKITLELSYKSSKNK